MKKSDRYVKIVERSDELPAAMAGKLYSGKFNLRLGERPHERLTIEAVKEGKSPNTYCAEVLENELNP